MCKEMGGYSVVGCIRVMHMQVTDSKKDRHTSANCILLYSGYDKTQLVKGHSTGDFFVSLKE